MNDGMSAGREPAQQQESDGALVMPAPDAAKSPLKANVYRAARQANTQLLPLFPYDGPGDIIPTCASMRAGGAAGARGYFLHTNQVDEVMVSFGSNGRVRTGDVFAGPKTHGVGGSADIPFFALTTVTQRQLERGAQFEAVAFPCEKCNGELFRAEFGTHRSGADERRYPPLPTLAGSAHAALQFNASEELRCCKACGHANPPFPLHVWGWDRYVHNTQIAEEARRSLDEAAGR